MTDPNLLAEASDPATSADRLRELSTTDRDLWPALAANPSTYPPLLDWLGQHGDAAVQAAIAARSSLPPAPPASPPPAPPAAPAPTAVPEPTVVLPAAGAPLPPPPGGTALPGPPTALGAPATGAGGGSDSTKIALIIAAVVLVLVAIGGGAWALAGGGDDDKDDTSASSGSSKDDEPADDEPTSEPSDDDPGFDDDADLRGPGSDDEFCDALTDLPSGTDQDAMVDYYASLADAAPDSLRDDIDTVVDFLENQGDPSDLGDFDEDDATAYIDAITAISEYTTNCY